MQRRRARSSDVSRSVSQTGKRVVGSTSQTGLFTPDDDPLQARAAAIGIDRGQPLFGCHLSRAPLRRLLRPDVIWMFAQRQFR